MKGATGARCGGTVLLRRLRLSELLRPSKLFAATVNVFACDPAGAKQRRPRSEGRGAGQGLGPSNITRNRESEGLQWKPSLPSWGCPTLLDLTQCFGETNSKTSKPFKKTIHMASRAPHAQRNQSITQAAILSPSPAQQSGSILVHSIALLSHLQLPHFRAKHRVLLLDFLHDVLELLRDPQPLGQELMRL